MSMWRSRKLSFESMESRAMMTVTFAEVDSSRTLWIKADDAADTIVIESNASGGIDATFDGSTMSFPSVSNIIIMTAGGDDKVLVDGLAFAYNVAIFTDDGHDTVTVVNSDLGGHTGIYTDSEDSFHDKVLVEDSTFGYLTVSTEGGEDTVWLSNVALQGTTAIYAGAEDDEVTLSKSYFGDELDVYGEQGDDGISIEASIARRTLIRGDDGNDEIDVANCEFLDTVAISGGLGDDTVQSSNNNYKTLKIRTIAGSDDIELDADTISGKLRINAGADDDPGPARIARQAWQSGAICRVSLSWTVCRGRGAGECSSRRLNHGFVIACFDCETLRVVAGSASRA